jgi:hypothetical protein
MRINSFTLVALLATFALALPARAAETTAVRALLIMASNNKTAADPKLAAYEAELQRNFPESSFRLVSEGSTSVSGNTPAKIDLGQGNRLEFDSEKRESDGIHLKVRWMKGNKPDINGSFVLQPGIPLVLGRRPAGDGDVPIIMVIAK